jgi:hypothetical protein
MSHLETLEADTHARAGIRSGIRELAAYGATASSRLPNGASHALFVRRGAVSYEPQERCAGRCFDICSGKHGDVAQLVEHLLCKQGVGGSSPLVSTRQALAAASSCNDGPRRILLPHFGVAGHAVRGLVIRQANAAGGVSRDHMP